MTATLTMDGAIARLTLKRPEALNALNRAMAHAIESCLKQLEASPEVTVVIVSGSGRSFCAGADISEMPTLSAAEAFRMGLVMRVVPDGALDAAAAELAGQVARHPRGGLAAAKAAVAEIRAGRPGGETRSFAALRTEGAAQERIAGFLERKRTRTS